MTLACSEIDLTFANVFPARLHTVNLSQEAHSGASNLSASHVALLNAKIEWLVTREGPFRFVLITMPLQSESAAGRIWHHRK